MHSELYSGALKPIADQSSRPFCMQVLTFDVRHPTCNTIFFHAVTTIQIDKKFNDTNIYTNAYKRLSK